MGRKLNIGDYVLLPKGSYTAPDDGILYAVIKDYCQLDQLNKFNSSIRKRKTGLTVRIFTDDNTEEITLDIPKTYPLIQFSTTELEGELELQPKRFLGTFVAKALVDHTGALFLNYGQVIKAVVRRGIVWCTVKFRKHSNGDQLTNLEFAGEDLIELEVTLMQYVLGLGMEVPFLDAEARVPQFRGILENMQREDEHSVWIKEFRNIVPAASDQVITDGFLESREVNMPEIIGDWDALARYLPGVAKPATATIVKDLSGTFKTDSEGFGECISGDPVTPNQAVSHPLRAQNMRRQEVRGTIPSHPPVLPPNFNLGLPTGPQIAMEPTSVWPEQAHDGYGAAMNPSGIYSKHGYYPSTAQLQKHVITFRNGAYGKSTSREEASAGIEAVLVQELMHAVKQDEAYIRAFCIMMGELMRVPFWCWRNPSLMASNYEERYMPVKWTKLPELTTIDVTEMDNFWELFYSMEAAAERYYVQNYCALLARIRVNIIEGFKVVGGRPGFNSMRLGVRKTIIQVLVAYMRLVVNRFVMEVLQLNGDVPSWMAREATMHSDVFTQHVRSRLTALQLNELTMVRLSSTPTPYSGGNTPKGASDGKEWSSKMTPEMRATIPRHHGKNMCLLSYTPQGCKKANCAYTHKAPGAPTCPGPLQEWIGKTYGAYVGP